MVLLIAVLGGVGAATRFVVDGSIRARWVRVFPLATLVINVSGSLIIGLVNGAHLYQGLGSTAVTVAATGFCGGYTTFSTAMAETVRLIQAGDARRATVNAIGSVLLCLGAAALGVALMAAW